MIMIMVMLMISIINDKANEILHVSAYMVFNLIDKREHFHMSI